MHYLKLLLTCLALAAFNLSHATDKSIYEDIIHSDLPLWSNGDNVWPQQFSNENEFGCISPTKLGDWRFKTSDDEYIWYRFQNYGVFHCWLNISEAYEQDHLNLANSQPSFFINLTDVDYEFTNYTIWTIQMGARPGSSYLFLARESDAKLDAPYLILQRKCPRRNVRSGPNLSILLTDYCSINSQKDLIRLAKNMLKRPPLGRLEYIEQKNNKL